MTYWDDTMVDDPAHVTDWTISGLAVLVAIVAVWIFWNLAAPGHPDTAFLLDSAIAPNRHCSPNGLSSPPALGPFLFHDRSPSCHGQGWIRNKAA